MKKVLLVLFALSLIICVSCRKEETIPNNMRRIAITVAIENDREFADLLKDDGYVDGLGQDFGIVLEIQETKNINDLKENADISFSDALITDYNNWLVPLCEGGYLQQFRDVKMSEPQFGKNGGRQYGFVFEEGRRTVVEPMLVVNMDMMNELGLKDEDFSPECFLSMLERLQDKVSVPLAVYGSPSESGFGVLLGLFGLTVTGGHEFYIDGDALHFDKIEDNAQQYIKYVHNLYETGLIPADCLSLNEYSCRIIFANKRCAMTMASSLENALDLVQYAKEKGVDASIVRLPVSDGLLEMNVFNRTIGMISKNNPNADLITAIFERIQNDINTNIVKYDEKEIDSFCLFKDQNTDRIEDLLEENFQDFHRFYEKHLMDDETIRPYYCQMMVGNIGLESFSDMKAEWMNSFDINVETVENNLSGRGLLQIFYAWVNRPTNRISK